MHAHDDDADADDATRAVPAWRPGRPITSPQCVTVPLRSLRYSPLPCSSSVLAQRTAVQIDLLRLRLRMHAFTVRKRCHTYVRTRITESFCKALQVPSENVTCGLPNKKQPRVVWVNYYSCIGLTD